MIQAVGDLIRYIVILIFLAALLEMILPQGEFRRYLRMLVGILLILTLLAPIQKIMSIAPYWDLPAEIEMTESDDELQGILLRGEKMQEENLNMVLKDYRSQLFGLLEKELFQVFRKELLHLELTLNEDPYSTHFGTVESLYLKARALEEPEKASNIQKRNLTGQEIEKVDIAVEIAGGENHSEDVSGSEKSLPEEFNSPRALEIENHLSEMIGLPLEKVIVKILP